MQADVEVAVDDSEPAEAAEGTPTPAPTEAKNPFRKPPPPAEAVADDEQPQPAPAGKNWPPSEEAAPAELPVTPLGSRAVPAEQPLRMQSRYRLTTATFHLALNPSTQARRPRSAAEKAQGIPATNSSRAAQVPALTVEKIAPLEIQVGKPATFEITVHNTGKVPAQDVEIHDEVPHGTSSFRCHARGQREARTAAWSGRSATIQPGEELSVKMELMPLTEGEIGSVATVQFRAEASVRTIATKPELAVEVTARQSGHDRHQRAAQDHRHQPWHGVATGVVLEERVPDGFTHPPAQNWSSRSATSSRASRADRI